MFFRFGEPFRWVDGFGSAGCLVAVFGLVVFAGFLTTVSRILSTVAAEHRRMEPGQVWLNLIPILNFIWMPVTVERVGESLRNELVARGRAGKKEEYGKTSGLTCLALLSTGVFPYVPVVTYPFALIYALIYWFQIGRYAGRLRAADRREDLVPEDEGW